MCNRRTTRDPVTIGLERSPRPSDPYPPSPLEEALNAVLRLARVARAA